MDYNKWGVVTGIVGLVLLLIGPLLIILSFFLNDEGIGFLSSIASYYLRYPSILFGITTFVFGILSIKLGNRKKTALIFGIIYFILIIILIGSSMFMSIRMAEIRAEKEADPEFQSWQRCRSVYKQCIDESIEECQRAGRIGADCSIDTRPCFERERECSIESQK